ncbi:MAG: hypothetical protein KA270_09980 [Saprospiraceae bacterium]|nr:hypothetical protein [Saprospiraceae bacterium]MBP6567486.1 hypothetical protein [Saprospiraceae bacterium]
MPANKDKLWIAGKLHKISGKIFAKIFVMLASKGWLSVKITFSPKG